MQSTITNKNGSITIYLSLVLCLIISVVLSITELSRMRLNRLYLQIASNAAIDSMLSLYDKKLWEYYRIFVVCYKTDELLKKEYDSYLMPYIYDKDSRDVISNWFVSKYLVDDSKLDYSRITEDKNFEKEAIEYMKMLLPGKVISMFNKSINYDEVSNINDVYNEVLEKKDEYERDSIYEQVDERYFDFDKEIRDLENYSRIINQNVSQLNRFIVTSRGMAVSKNKQTAHRAVAIVSQINSYTHTININIIRYKELMEQFRLKVIESENNFESDLSSGLYNYNDVTIEFIRSEFEHFKEYVDENNEMNLKAEQLSLELEEKLSVLDEYETSFREYIRDIESLEAEKRSILRERYEGYAEDIRQINDEIKEINEEIYEEGKDFRDELSSLEFTEPNLMASDGASNSMIDSLKSLLSSTEDFVLRLVMDEESYERLSSAEINMNEYNIKSNNNLLDKVLMGEYFFDMYNYHNKEKLHEETPSKSNALEVERLLFNKNSDIDNMKSTVYRLLLIREGLNLMHIYSDTNKRETAREFVYLVFGALTPIVAEIVYLLVLSAWAFAQAVVDVRDLLNNKRVMFFHNNESFRFDVEDIFVLCTGSLTGIDINEYEVSDNDIAFNYKDYLRLLLFLENGDNLNSRAISIIQYNISKEQGFFDIDKSIYSFDAENEFESNNIFNKILFFNLDNNNRNKYKVKVKAYASY